MIFLGFILGIILTAHLSLTFNKSVHRDAVKQVHSIRHNLYRLTSKSAEDVMIPADGAYIEVPNDTSKVITRVLAKSEDSITFLSRVDPTGQYTDINSFDKSMRIELVSGDLKYLFIDSNKTHIFELFKEFKVPANTKFKYLSQNGFICVFTLY